MLCTESYGPLLSLGPRRSHSSPWPRAGPGGIFREDTAGGLEDFVFVFAMGLEGCLGSSAGVVCHTLDDEE